MGGKRTLERGDRTAVFTVHLLPCVQARSDVTAFDHATVLASDLNCALNPGNSNAEKGQVEKGLLVTRSINQLRCSDLSLRIKEHDTSLEEERSSGDDHAATSYEESPRLGHSISLTARPNVCNGWKADSTTTNTQYNTRTCLMLIFYLPWATPKSFGRCQGGCA